MMFERIAGGAYRRRWLALAAWVRVLGAVTVPSQLVDAQYHNGFSLPRRGVAKALDQSQRQAPARAGDTIQAVMRHSAGLTAAQTKARAPAPAR